MRSDPPSELPEAVLAPPAAVGETGARAIRGGAIRVGGYLAGILVSLGSATILVRHLGIKGFGRYVTVTSLVALVGGVTEAGIVVHGIREFLARDARDRRRLLANLMAMRLTLATLGVIVATCFALAIGYRQVIVIGVLVAGAGLLVQVIADVLSISLQAELLLGRLTLVELGRRVLTLVFVAALALAGAGLLSLLAASTLAGAAALGAIAVMVRSRVSVGLSFDWRAWRELLAETSVYAIALSIAAIYLYATVIVVSTIASATQTGLFATSFRVVQTGLAIPGLLLTAVFPLLTQARRDGDRGAGAIGKVLTVALICGVWMSLVTILGASFIVDVIAGQKGHGSVPVLRIQAAMFAVSFIFTAAAIHLVSIRRYRPLLIASSSALALNVLLALLLVPSLGAEGGAIADVVTEAAAAIGLTVALTRAVAEPLVTRRFLALLAVAGAASASIVLLPIGSVAHACGATLIYFAILLAGGAFPPELLDAGRRLLRMRPA